MRRKSTPFAACLGAIVLLQGCDEPVIDPGWTPDLQLLVCGPDVAERVVALGSAAAIQGADTASLGIPGVGEPVDLGSDCERAAEIAPELPVDLALVAGEAEGIVEALEALGVRTRVLAANSLNEITQAHHDLGALLGRDDRARILVAEMTRGISAIATLRDGEERTRVAWLVDVGGAPGEYVAVGATGILHEILELAGADNAFHSGAPRLSVDGRAIAEARPDLVLVSSQIRVELAVLPVPAELSRLPILDPLPRVQRLHALLYPEAQASAP